MGNDREQEKPKLRDIFLFISVILFGFGLIFKIDKEDFYDRSNLVEVHGVLGWIGVKKGRYGGVERTNVWIDSGKGAFEYYLPDNYKHHWKAIDRIEKGDRLIAYVSPSQEKWIWELTSKSELIIAYYDRSDRWVSSKKSRNKKSTYFVYPGIIFLLCAAWLHKREKKKVSQ